MDKTSVGLVIIMTGILSICSLFAGDSKAEIPELSNAYDTRFVSPYSLKEALSVLESQNNLLINRIKVLEKKIDKVCK